MYHPFIASTTRNEANLLRFTPPGFPCSIDVPFPGRLLPVCETCKKNYKTREHCRNRECHTGLPWSKCFVCVSLDPSCTKENNTLVSGPFISRLLPPQPLCFTGEVNPETTLCGMCKDKNYTRAHCRMNKKHRQLPWNTVFIALSYDPNIQLQEYEDGIASNRKKHSRKKRKVTSTDGVKDEQNEDVVGQLPMEEVKACTSEAMKKSQEYLPSPSLPEPSTFVVTSNFDMIPRSRTFLCIASQTSISVEWMDYDTSMHEAVSMPFRDGRFMGMFGYNFMPPPPPPIGPGDWYHPSMSSNMFEGREGPLLREYPPFRDVPEHMMAAMMRDGHVPMDNRGYPMGQPLPPPEVLEQFHSRMGRPHPSYLANPPGSMNFSRSSYPIDGMNTDSRALYGQRSMGDVVSPRSPDMMHASSSQWNGNVPGSFWPGRLLPPSFPSFSGYTMEESRGTNDGSSGNHGEDNTQGKSTQL